MAKHDPNIIRTRHPALVLGARDSRIVENDAQRTQKSVQCCSFMSRCLGYVDYFPFDGVHAWLGGCDRVGLCKSRGKAFVHDASYRDGGPPWEVREFLVLG